MNQGKSSKFVPGLPDDDDNNISTNENIPTAPDSTINIFEGVAECTVNENDTFKSIKVKAKNLAQDNVQKQIADYIRAFLKDRYLTLPDDETLSIANEISTIIDVKYNVLDSDDDIVIRATVTAQLDNNDIMKCLIRFFKERAELKSQNETLRNEIEDLKRQIDELPNKIILSYQKYLEATKLYGYRNEDAIKLYDKAIQLNPNYSEAYLGRGLAYDVLKQYERAIQDYDKAIQFNPNYDLAYCSRGNAYHSLKQNERAIQDYDKVIQLNPNYDLAYYSRGVAYQVLNKYEQAFKDFDKAFELNPDNKFAKKEREACLRAMGK